MDPARLRVLRQGEAGYRVKTDPRDGGVATQNVIKTRPSPGLDLA